MCFTKNHTFRITQYVLRFHPLPLAMVTSITIAAIEVTSLNYNQDRWRCIRLIGKLTIHQLYGIYQGLVQPKIIREFNQQLFYDQ